jgi:hypothetical protein
MSDTAILAASVKITLLEIAKQASALGVGLQNAAPGEKTGVPNNSVQYLLNISTNITKIAADCEKFQPDILRDIAKPTWDNRS